MIELKGISKSYETQTEPILSDFSFRVDPGKSVAISGPSGRGKTTLLNILGLLDNAFEGEYLFQGKSVKGLSAQERSCMRNQYFGFIFQSFMLIPHLTVLDNIALPLYYQNVLSPKAHTAARALLEAFEMQKYEAYYPNMLSGGQQQRVALMRALVHQPRCLLSDEVTSQLDKDTEIKIVEYLFDYQKRTHCALLIVTHNLSLAQRCDVVLDL